MEDEEKARPSTLVLWKGERAAPAAAAVRREALACEGLGGSSSPSLWVDLWVDVRVTHKLLLAIRMKRAQEGCGKGPDGSRRGMLSVVLGLHA